VTHEVHELENAKESSEDEVNVLAATSPGRLGVVRMEEEVHRQSHK
jgi:hypothetical protein